MTYIPQLQPICFFLSDIRKASCKSRQLLYSRGSDALIVILRTLKLCNLKTILLPAYVCASVTKTVVACGFKPYFYDVDDLCRVDYGKINSILRESKIDLLLLVHYFGFAQPVEEIASICKTHGVFLIEDCAHSPLSSLNGKRLGEFGDASIFSLWKSFPIPDGGALLVNRKLDLSSPVEKAKSIQIINVLLKEWMRLVFWKLQVPPVRIAQYPSQVELEQRRRDAIINPGHPPKPRLISLPSHWILNSLNFGEIITRRRENFIFWLENLSEFSKLNPIYEELPDGIVPFSFPVLTSNRDEIRKNLRRKGIYLGAGFPEAPVVPAGKEHKFKCSQYLARNLLELPVHQALRPHHLRKVLAYMIDFIGGN